MLLCALFASSMAFPVMIWRTAAEYGEFTEKLEPVSILLLKAPFLQEEKIEELPYRRNTATVQLRHVKTVSRKIRTRHLRKPPQLFHCYVQV